MTDSTDTSAQQPPPIALEALSGDPTLVDNPSDNPNSNPSERTTRIVDEKATEEQAPIYVPAAEQQNDQDQFETTKNNCYCHHQDKGPEEENVASSTVPAADREDLLDLAKNPNIICFTCKSEFHKGMQLVQSFLIGGFAPPNELMLTSSCTRTRLSRLRIFVFYLE